MNLKKIIFKENKNNEYFEVIEGAIKKKDELLSTYINLKYPK